MFKVFGTCRTTADCEVRVTPKGTSITKVNAAVNRRYKDEAGATHEITDFWSLIVWGATGENFSKLVTKGTKIAICGDITQDHWDDKETKKPRSAPVINVQSWEFAESKKPAPTGDKEEREEVAAAGDKIPF